MGADSPDPTPPPALTGEQRAEAPLSLPLAYARFTCPYCGETRRFESRVAYTGAAGAYLCRCQRALGRVEVNSAGWTVLRLATVPAAADRHENSHLTNQNA